MWLMRTGNVAIEIEELKAEFFLTLINVSLKLNSRMSLQWQLHWRV